MVRNLRRIRFTIALSLALAAGAAPTAWARYVQEPSASSSPASAGVCSEVCSAGGYGTNPGIGSKVARPVAATGGAATVASSVKQPVASSDGFDWGDAGIGAGGALALVAVVTGGVLVVTSSRRRGAHRSAQSTT
jgi:hypothetical protein